MSNSNVMLCFVLVAAGACSHHDGAPGGLDREEVSEIPAGSANGSDASGAYEVEAYTSACQGLCSTGEGLLGLTVCDVGDRSDYGMEVDQSDGRLQVDGDDSLFVSRLVGGIESDGSFDIGGYGTELGGAVEATGRMSGEIDGDDVSGMFELWVHGTYQDEPIDCRASYEVTGSKQSNQDDD